MERRLAVHAGGNAKALTYRLGGSRTTCTIALAAVVLSAAPAYAQPKNRAAKAAFDRGLAAYRKQNFDAASKALAQSFELERDADTLFAWAQAQRQLDHCDKAIELYEQLLTFELPVENRAAVYNKLTECRDLVAAQGGGEPKVAPLQDEPTPPVAQPTPPPPPATPVPEATSGGERGWYKDPIGMSLLGSGVIVTGIGAGLLLSARSLENDSKAAFQNNHYDDAESLASKANSRGDLGAITLGVGGVLVVGGVVWLAMHRGSNEQRAVSAWVNRDGGGLAVIGGF